MNRMPKRILGTAAALAAVAMLVTACDSGTPTTAPTTAPTTTPTAAPGLTCDATQLGPITRCENFYTDYWPVIQAELDRLYEEAKTTADGVVVVWDWFEQDPAVVAAFNAKYPDLTIKSQGLTYERAAAIVSARATGSETTDVVGGTLTIDKQLWEQGFFANIDWTVHGIPAEFLVGVGPGAFPDSINGYILQYNSTAIDPAQVPDNLEAFADSSWGPRSVALASWESQAFAGIGMASGQETMVNLINAVQDDETLLLSSDSTGLMSSGDVPIALSTWLTTDNPNIQLKPYRNAPGFTQSAGVNEDAQNPAGAKIWALWNAFDPDWIKTRLTDPAYSSTAIPWLGLPSDFLGQAQGLMAKNIAAYVDGLEKGFFVWETLENRDAYIDIMNAADDLLGESW